MYFVGCCAQMHSLSTRYRIGVCGIADSTPIKIIIYIIHYLYLADVNDCVGVTCSGYGICLNGVNSHSCNYNAGYTVYMCKTNMSFYSVVEHSNNLHAYP